jgi:hypothetical protein
MDVLQCAQAGVSSDDHADQMTSHTYRMSTDVLQYAHVDVALDHNAH